MNTATLCQDIRCDHSNSERPRYYARQLITADDMTLEQDYFRSKLRLHNRMLHGWGIVCGAEVKPVTKDGKTVPPWNVVITPGYILGPYGDEIVIDCERTFDLRGQSMIGVAGEPCVEESDPWCSEVHETRDDKPLFLAIRYKEVMTRPVRVQPSGCGCDDSACEYSRLRDGYEIKVLKACPSSHTQTGPEAGACLPCPKEPWIVLKTVQVDPNGEVKFPSPDNCRRQLPAIANQSEARFERKPESLIIMPPESDVDHEESSRERIVIPSLSETITEEKALPGKKKAKK